MMRQKIRIATASVKMGGTKRRVSEVGATQTEPKRFSPDAKTLGSGNHLSVSAKMLLLRVHFMLMSGGIYVVE